MSAERPTTAQGQQIVADVTWMRAEVEAVRARLTEAEALLRREIDGSPGSSRPTHDEIRTFLADHAGER